MAEKGTGQRLAQQLRVGQPWDLNLRRLLLGSEWLSYGQMFGLPSSLSQHPIFVLQS